MFGLGVFVGRQTTPVLFETRPFQEYLGQMVSRLSDKMPGQKKVDLKFYDVLDEPVYHSVKGKTKDAGEITPGPESGNSVSIQPVTQNPGAEDIPVKHSKKLATWHQVGQGGKNGAAPASTEKKKTEVKARTNLKEKQAVPELAPKALKSKPKTDEKTAPPPEAKTRDAQKAVKSPAPANDSGAYTIQIASYKDLNDALSHMVRLNEKGVATYRASVTINKETWYRVRTGSFADYETARTRLSQLVGSGVNGMVIKKE